jgi:hypothetical protein
MRIYTTTIPATNRFWTFMHDRQYRAAVAWQQSSYNQPTDTSFFVGAGMAPQPTANIITKLDTTPPVISAPTNITVDATSTSGTAVDFTATALDDVSGNVPVFYNVQPGTTFPIGTTLVTLMATDAYGNTSTASFNVTVSSLTVSRSGFTLNRRTGRVIQQVTIQNIGSTTVAGPIYLALDNLSSNTSLANSVGTTSATPPAGSPYALVSSVDLAAGSSTTASLEFTIPTSGGITYTSRTLSNSITP